MNQYESDVALRRRAARTLAGALLSCLAITGVQAAEQPQTVRGAISTNPVAPTLFTGTVRNLPAVKGWQPGDAIKEIPKRGGAAAPTKFDRGAWEKARAEQPARDQ